MRSGRIYRAAAAILHNAALCYLALPYIPLQGGLGVGEPWAMKVLFALMAQGVNTPQHGR